MSCSVSRDVEWTLKPILTWMQILGLPLYHFQNNSKMGTFSICLFGLSMLAINMVSNVFFTINMFHMTTKNFQEQGFKKASLAFSWSVYIYVLSVVCNRIGTHVSFLRAAHSPWKSLQECVDQLEHEFRFSSAVYHKLRKFSFVGIGILIAVYYKRYFEL